MIRTHGQPQDPKPTGTPQPVRKRYFTRQPLLTLLASILLLSVTLFVPQTPSPVGSPPRPSPRVRSSPHFQVAWRKPVPSLSGFSLSPSGDAVALIYSNGKLHCFGKEGELLWGASFLKPPSVVLSDSGDVGLAYYRGNRFLREVVLFKAGKTIHREKLDSPLVAAALSPDGSVGAVASLDGRLHLFHIESVRCTTTRLSLEDTPRALIAARMNLFLLGFRGRSGVEALSADGKRVWTLPGEVGFVYDLYLSPEGQNVGILSYRPKSGDKTSASLITSTGHLLWHAVVEGIFPRMNLETNGLNAAVGVTEVMHASKKTTYARKIGYYDARGNRLWEKGGLFFSPQLLGTISPGPGVIAKGSGGDLFVLGAKGRIIHLLDASKTGPIRQAVASSDGKALVAWGQDNTLEYLKWQL